MAVAPVEGAKVVSRDITGGYQGEYPFSITYRISPGGSTDKRLIAIEVLNKFAVWAEENTPDLGDGINVIKVQKTYGPVLIERYKGGDEDYQAMLNITFERVK